MSKRGTPANHLLNFQYTPPPVVESTHSRYQNENTARMPKVDAATCKRAFFLNSFQFILGGEALIEASRNPSLLARIVATIHDFDSLVSWDCVTFVVVRCSFDEYICPICLEPPCSPRLTTCGHVFCYPCILRHLRQQKENEQKRTCPLCSASVTTSGLRPVIFRPIAPIQVGCEATFDLLLREKTSCITLHSSCFEAISEEEFVCEIPLFGSASSDFSRYALETNELCTTAIQQDLSNLSERMNRVYGLEKPLFIDDQAELDSLSEALKFVTSQQSGCVWGELKLSRSGLPQLLYRVVDGQQIYLHPINMRMLQEDAKEGALAKRVTGQVLQMETVIQTAHTRHVFKPFAHIPLHSSFTLCLLDLKTTISSVTAKKFDAAIARKLISVDAEEEHLGQSDPWENYKAHMMSALPATAPPQFMTEEAPSEAPEPLEQDAQLPSAHGSWSRGGALVGALRAQPSLSPVVPSWGSHAFVEKECAGSKHTSVARLGTDEATTQPPMQRKGKRK